MTATPEDPAGATVAPLVELDDVSKFYGNIKALEHVSLEVHAGEITCVLGDNGAGKSTLIKIIAGLHRHDAGRFLIEGRRPRSPTRETPWTGASPPSTRTSPSSR